MLPPEQSETQDTHLQGQIEEKTPFQAGGCIKKGSGLDLNDIGRSSLKISYCLNEFFLGMRTGARHSRVLARNCRVAEWPYTLLRPFKSHETHMICKALQGNVPSLVSPIAFCPISPHLTIYLLSIYYVSGTVLGAGVTAANRTEKVTILMHLKCQ